MRAAPKRAILVDQAIAVCVEQGTSAAPRFRQFLAARAPQRLGREESFAFGQEWSASRQLEVAAIFPAQAIAFDRAISQLAINLAHLVSYFLH